MNEMKVTSYYEADHDRLDELFKSFQQLKRTDMETAQNHFHEFRSGLLRHIAWEEEILFPLFEKQTGMVHAGPTEVMRREHAMIKKHLEAINQKIAMNDVNTDDDEYNMLNILGAHNRKEEQILYPAIDRSLNHNEVATVFSSMENVPAERFR